MVLHRFVERRRSAAIMFHDMNEFVIVGLAFGAAIGALTTDSTIDELRVETSEAFNKGFWLRLKTNPLSFFTHLQRIEAIVVLAVGLVAVGAIVGVFSPHSGFPLLFGSFVGFVAAPWVWLHFSRNLTRGKKSKDSPLERYKFLTIVLGVVLLVSMVMPYAQDWLRRISKVEAFGVSIALSSKTVGVSNGVFSLAGNPIASTTDQLAVNTANARQIAIDDTSPSPTSGEPILSELANFERRSVILRDTSFIAYLVHEYRNDGATIKTLNAYNDSAWEGLGGDKRGAYRQDWNFVETTTGPLFDCLASYSAAMKDFHLYLIDAGPVLEQFLIIIQEGDGPSREDTWQQFESKAKGIIDRASTVIDKINSGSDVGNKITGCDHSLGAASYPTNETPYPRLVAAYALAAADSTETGIVLLSNWLEKHTVNLNLDEPGSVILPTDWYVVRAMITIEQLAGTIRQDTVPRTSIEHFQRRLTDLMAHQLGIGAATNWRRFCDHLQPNTIHAGIGRRLAFTYATIRNELFELNEPQVTSSTGAYSSGRRRPLTEDIEEAEAIRSTADYCFYGVPAFDKDSRHWIGEWTVDIAQLRISALAAADSDERARMIKTIRAELDRAKILLGNAPDRPKASAADQLLRVDNWEHDRQRIQSLRDEIAQIESRE